jgi:hypothetical protein
MHSTKLPAQRVVPAHVDFAPGSCRSRVARSSQPIDPPVTGIGNARKANGAYTRTCTTRSNVKPVRKWVASKTGGSLVWIGVKPVGRGARFLISVTQTQTYREEGARTKKRNRWFCFYYIYFIPPMAPRRNCANKHWS